MHNKNNRPYSCGIRRSSLFNAGLSRLRFGGALTLSVLAPSVFAATVCPDQTEHAQSVQARKDAIVDQVDSQIDTSTNIEDSPFLYENADASCDLGFSLPGLPDIGLGLDGIDTCSLLKAVTGDMVKELNDSMQDTVDKALIDAVGTTDLEYDVDLEEIATDAIKGE